MICFTSICMIYDGQFHKLLNIVDHVCDVIAEGDGAASENMVYNNSHISGSAILE